MLRHISFQREICLCVFKIFFRWPPTQDFNIFYRFVCDNFLPRILSRLKVSSFCTSKLLLDVIEMVSTPVMVNPQVGPKSIIPVTPLVLALPFFFNLPSLPPSAIIKNVAIFVINDSNFSGRKKRSCHQDYTGGLIMKCPNFYAHITHTRARHREKESAYKNIKRRAAPVCYGTPDMAESARRAHLN